jgi:hypothetical protein
MVIAWEGCANCTAAKSETHWIDRRSLMRTSHGNLSLLRSPENAPRIVFYLPALALAVVACALPNSAWAGAIIAINVSPDSVGATSGVMDLPGFPSEPVPAQPERVVRFDDSLARGCGAPSNDIPRQNGSSQAVLASAGIRLAGEPPCGWLLEGLGPEAPVPPNFELLKVPKMS